MRALSVALIFFVVVSCGQQPKNQLKHLNGYWEIAFVRSSNGDAKAYNYNTTIDYIYIKDGKGFRKKLQPGINNSYKTSDDAEALEVKIENDSLNLYYSTPLMNWKETVLKANETELEVINKEQVIYVYKRYQPINLNLTNE